MKTLLPLVLSLLIVYACRKDAPENNTKPIVSSNETKLSEKFSHLDTTSHVPGFAVSIVKNYELVYQDAFGYADVGAQLPYTNETTQSIGQLGDLMLGVATISCIDQGMLSLNAPINKLLPFKIVNPKRPAEAIRIKHLVSHTSGILDHPINYPLTYDIYPGQDLSTEGASVLINTYFMGEGTPLILDSIIKNYFIVGGAEYHEENFVDVSPGQIHIPSNMGAQLLAYILQLQTGHLYEGYVRGSVFQPLDMLRTSYRRDEFPDAVRAKLYLTDTIAIPDYTMYSYYSNGLYTNNLDFGKFLKNMTQGAVGQTNTLFGDTNYVKLFEPISTDYIDGYQPSVFWLVNEESVERYGYNLGTSAYIYIDKLSGNGFTIMANIDASTDERRVNWISFVDKIREQINEYWALN